MAESLENPDETNRWRLPPVALVAVSVLIGIFIGDAVQLSIDACLAVFFTWLVAGLITWRIPYQGSTFLCFCMASICFGMLRIQMQQLGIEGIPMQRLCQDGVVEVVVTGKITSLPVVHRKAESVYAPRMYGPPHQTRFRLEVNQITIEDDVHSVKTQCQVHLEGQANDTVACGDVVRIAGRLDWPKPPGNPGEFNYQQFLTRKQLAGMLFVDSISDIEVVQSASRFAPLRLLGELRNEIYRIIVLNVDADVRGIAMALLLGSRHELPSDVERAFVASGTMHLLAISGLHVGILCVFLMQIQHALLVRRNIALLITLLICVSYAFLTDLRPSVIRATLFFVVFVVGEFFHRPQNVIGLLSLTALIMLTLQPGIVFEIGAWLSFLSVAGLGWQADNSRNTTENGEVPLEPVSWNDHLTRLFVFVTGRLKLRWQQMIAILIFTTPLVVTTFHVFSPIGLMVNLALIPLTAVALCCGFLTISLGLLFRDAAALTGWAFSELLHLISSVVSSAASMRFGHFFFADFPAWFVPCYYVLLILVLLRRRHVFQRIALTAVLVLCSVVALVPAPKQPVVAMRCTILDVGQGNATVIECPDGSVFLIDAGARNRSDRSADIVCRYLWGRGICELTGIIISHADTDHFNGLPGIMARLNVKAISLPSDFSTTDHPAVSAIQTRIAEHRIPISTIRDGDSFSAGNVEFNFHQTPPQDNDLSLTADERSVVVVIEHFDHRIVLPGDLRGRGTESLLPEIGAADVFVASNHGSIGTNDPLMAAVIQPEFVISSSSDADSRPSLENVYAAAHKVVFTSDSGAVVVTSEPNQPLRMDTYR